ncbi:MAG TPA: alpha/beta hydrolase [Pyrinomonadaceae bacterium]|nr:alpha/beta hydrolase [Pyrinomonadaceae bacterium]
MSEQTKGNKKTIVLVHGAFADGSSWSKVISILLEKDYEVIAVQNPTDSLKNDVDAVNRALESVSGPVVLAGHSWGGVVITEAGVHEKVGALVYVAAFAPSVGQSVNDLFAPFPQPEWFGAVSADSGGFLKISTRGIGEYFAQDLNDDEKAIVAAVQTPFALSSNAEKVTNAAWENKPSWYVVSTEDRIIYPELERKLAEKLGAKTTEVSASHVSMLSKPDEIAQVIIEAAESLETQKTAEKSRTTEAN